MPRFEENGDADDAALAHPLSEARARSVTQTQFRSAAIPDWRRAPEQMCSSPTDRHRSSIPTRSGIASATSRSAASYPPTSRCRR